MEIFRPLSIKYIVGIWKVEGVVLLSLAIHAILVLFGPLRKRTGNGFIIGFIWSAYLLADLVSTYGVGLISERIRNSTGVSQAVLILQLTNLELLILWLPFLLLHLGGPDTVTGFSLEDNELSLRKLFTLGSQAATAVYIFLQISDKVHRGTINLILCPTILVFIAGIIKCFERIRALHLASVAIVRETTEKQFRELDKNLEGKDDLQMACIYSKFYQGMIVDYFTVSRLDDFIDGPYSNPNSAGEPCDFKYFRNNFTNPEAAMRMIEIELNFVYEFFHTKIKVVLSVFGISLRLISFALILAAFSVFIFQVTEYPNTNQVYYGITYTLFIGAISVEIISFVMLLFCASTRVALMDAKRNFGLNRLARRPSSLSRMWSCSISGFSWTKYLVKARPLLYDYQNPDPPSSPSKTCRRLSDQFINSGLAKILNDLRIRMAVSSEALPNQLWEFIFAEIQKKEKFVADAAKRNATGSREAAKRRVYSSGGEWALAQWGVGERIFNCTNRDRECTEQPPRHPDFIPHLLVWHAATELLYNTEEEEEEEEEDNNNNNQFRHRWFSKLLSDYMMYLAVSKPDMLNAVPNQIMSVLVDTVKMTQHFRGTPSLEPIEVKFACESILNYDNSSLTQMPHSQKIDEVIFPTAVRLARELRVLGRKEKWELMSQVWVEILAYAASHCRPRTHAQQLCYGGELATIVWVLMLHFDLVFFEPADRSHLREFTSFRYH